MPRNMMLRRTMSLVMLALELTLVDLRFFKNDTLEYFNG